MLNHQWAFDIIRNNSSNYNSSQFKSKEKATQELPKPPKEGYGSMGEWVYDGMAGKEVWVNTNQFEHVPTSNFEYGELQSLQEKVEYVQKAFREYLKTGTYVYDAKINTYGKSVAGGGHSPKCECGSHIANAIGHSTWCPLYRESK